MSYPQQSYQAMEMQAPGQQPGNQSPDLLAMIWRWKWLPVLGGLLGLAVGLLVWVQMPPQFLAFARIQVVTPRGTDLPFSNLDDGSSMITGRADDVVILQSSSVIKNAIEIGRLDSNPKLEHVRGDELMRWLRHKKRLTVRPGTKELSTSIVEVTFRCEDAELAAEVVQSLVTGYEQFIGHEANVLSRDVLEKLAKFQDDYDKRAKIAREDYLRLNKSTPLIRVADGEFKDLDTEQLLAATQKLTELRGKMSKYQTAMDQAKETIARDPKSLEYVLNHLQRLTNDQMALREDPLTRQLKLDGLKNFARPSQQMKTEKLEPLLDRRKMLLAKYGENHSLVADLTPLIDSYQERISAMEALEQESYRERSEILQSVNVEGLDPSDYVNKLLGSMDQEIRALRQEIQDLERQASGFQKRSKEIQDTIVNLKVIEDEMESIGTSASELKTSLERLNMGTGYGSKTMKRLEIPTQGAPDGPSLLKYLGLSGFIGACLFTCLAYLLELADRSYRGPEEIASDLGVPILGHIQMSTLSRKDRKDDKIDLSMVTFHKAKSTAAEAFRGVRTSIYFGNQAGSIKVIQVTSPVPGDGKSTVAANLAISMAQSGRRTLLLDCDMRRPRLAKLIGVREDLGLTNILAGKLKIEEAVQSTAVPNMDILTCGRRPGNPAELLLSDDFVDVINALRDQYDYIIMDTPPILAVSDPANASACADGIILTLRLRRNLRPIAVRAAQMLQSVNANLLGVVINGVTGRGGYGYGGYRYDGSRTSAGYGGYGYGGTYGYGDYYSSSMAEPVEAKEVVRSRPTNGQVPPVES